jgi:hypothetical protein
VLSKERARGGWYPPGTMAHNPTEDAVDERILAQRAQHSPSDHDEHEDAEERNCFYCLSGWVFLGSLNPDGEEIVEAIRCRRCSGQSRLKR